MIWIDPAEWKRAATVTQNICNIGGRKPHISLPQLCNLRTCSIHVQQLTIHMVYFMKRLWKQLHHQAQIYSIEYVYKHILCCIYIDHHIYTWSSIYSIRYVYKHILYCISELDDVVVSKAFSWSIPCGWLIVVSWMLHVLRLQSCGCDICGLRPPILHIFWATVAALFHSAIIIGRQT